MGGSGSSLEAKGEQILLSGRPKVDLTAVLAPQRGLTTTGEIADPRVFQEDPVGFIAAVGAMQAASDAGAGPMSGGGQSAGPQGPGGGPMGPDPAMGPMGDPVADMVQGEGEVSVYIAGLAGPSGDLAALIVHKDTGRTLWVSTGQQAFGYSVSMVTNRACPPEEWPSVHPRTRPGRGREAFARWSRLTAVWNRLPSGFAEEPRREEREDRSLAPGRPPCRNEHQRQLQARRVGTMK